MFVDRSSVATEIAHLFGVSVFVKVEVVRHAGVERFQSQKVGHHADHGGPLAVGNAVENFVDLVRMVDGNGNRMGSL